MQVVHGKGGTVQSAWFEWACVHTFTPPYSGFEPKGDACKVHEKCDIIDRCTVANLHLDLQHHVVVTVICLPEHSQHLSVLGVWCSCARAGAAMCVQSVPVWVQG